MAWGSYKGRLRLLFVRSSGKESLFKVLESQRNRGVHIPIMEPKQEDPEKCIKELHACDEGRWGLSQNKYLPSYHPFDLRPPINPKP